MATYLDVSTVQYMAASGVCAPLSSLYFCRHCLKIRSSECVSHEVDSHYCPNCMENMPAAEAKLKKNRCANCFDCPSCCHSLSTRATSVVLPDPDQPNKTTPKKVYYLACGFCRWTSRDVGIKDQLVASGGWKEQQNPHDKRIGALLDYYRQLAQREKADKEKKKYIRRRSYLQLSDKFGLSALAARRRTGLMGMGSLSLKDDEVKIQEVDQCVAADQVAPLSENFYTQPVELTKVTNMRQRHRAPDTQPRLTSDMYPKHRQLLVKRSQRCRECEHNLSKPEFNPCSIKYKIQLVALHHVPEVRIMSRPNLLQDQMSQVIISVYNPLDTVAHLSLLPSSKAGLWGTAKVELPTCALTVSPRDDVAEFDDGSEQQQDFKDDPSVVVFRKNNRLGFFINVTPLLPQDDVKVSFELKYDYRHVSTALHTESKEPQIVFLQHPVFLNLGSLTA